MAAVMAAEHEEVAGVVYEESCPKCRGSGLWSGSITCFKCGGKGRLVYKTSPEQRAARAAAKAAVTPEQRAKRKTDQERRDEARAQARWDAWAAAEDNFDHATWITSRIEEGPEVAGPAHRFASDMAVAVRRYGSLTVGQRGAVQKWIAAAERRAERIVAAQTEAAQQEKRAEEVHEVNLQAVEQAFARAKSQGIKWPKLTLDGFSLAPAGENSRNHGAIYVTEGARGGTYLGKVLAGRFLPVRECTDDIKARVLEAMADPLASAVAYGKKFGRCAVCARELSDPESIERGIGPICAGRMGW